LREVRVIFLLRAVIFCASINHASHFIVCGVLLRTSRNGVNDEMQLNVISGIGEMPEYKSVCSL
jgi:hypothetical protein